jgi:hypothetical protein
MQRTATATDNPAVCGGTTGPGVWYSFVGDGQEWTITATPNAWDPEIQVLSGACGAFVCEVAADGFGTGGAETATLLTEDGTEYYVFVGTWASFDFVIDSFELTVSCETIDPCGPFVGDSASNPIVIASLPYTDIQNTAECFTNQYAVAFGSPDVFYQVTTGPDATGLIIDLCNAATDFDTYLYLVDATGTTTLFDNDDNGGSCSFLDVPVSPNTTYLIVVEGSLSTDEGTFEITVEEVTDPVIVPANDLCEDAEVITCSTNIAVAAATATATGNPAVCGGTTGPGVWYSFVGDGQEWTITATPNAWDPEIQILSGACGAFVCEVAADGLGTSGAETATLLTVDGTEYYAFVGTWASFDLVIDSFELTVSCETIDPCGPFVGDSASNPIVIASVPYTDIQNTAECFTNQYAVAFGSPDVFYQVTTGPDATGLIIDLCNAATDFDTYLYLVDATGTTTLFDNDDNGGSCSFLDVPVSPNTTYLIVVEGSLSTDEGTFEITVEEVTDPVIVPANDLCEDAEVITCSTNIAVAAATATATGNPAVCGGTTGPGVWYSFVGDGQEWTVTATPNAWDPEIQILSGACGAFVCEVAADGLGTSGAETASLLTVDGTEYYVFVGTWASFDLVIDSFELTVSCETIDPCGPFVGDSASNPIVIASVPYTDIQNTAECFTNQYAVAFGSPDVFYQVTTGPDATGLIIDLCNAATDFDTYLYLVDATGTTTLFDNDDNGGSCSFLDVPVSPNTTYLIVVEGSLSTDEGTFEITIEEVTDPVIVPANDLCEDAEVITCSTNIAVAAATATATGNPAVCGGTTGPGVWYSFIGDGQEWTITATPNAWDPEIQVLTGTCGVFDCEVNADGFGTGDAESVTVLTEVATEYYVFVGTWASFDLVIDSFELTVSCETIDPCGPFVGDSASNPIVIASVPYTDIQNTAECFTNQYAVAFGSPDVFYQITTGPDATGLIIDLCNAATDFDTYLYLVDATGTTTLFDNDDNGGSCSFLDVPVSPNTTYLIVVEGSLSTDEGTFEITVEEVTDPVIVPANDLCEDAEVITCTTNIAVAAATATATGNATECGGTTGPGVWYSFIGDGQEWTITATPNAWDPEIQILSGACGAFVCETAVDGNGTSGAETATLLTADGTEYLVFVGTWASFDTEIDSFELTVSCEGTVVEPPANDLCADAEVITCTTNIAVAAATATATGNATECGGTTGPGVWYSFVGDGQEWTITATPNAWDPEIQILSGACGAFVCETAVDGNGTSGAETATLLTVDGTEYLVFVGTWASFDTEIDSFELTVSCEGTVVEPPANDLCADAEVITCTTNIAVAAATATATGNATECGGTTGPGVWYSFVGDGQEWTITATPNAWDPEIQILSGACGAFVCEAASDNNGTSGAETATLLTVDGTEYLVFVGTWASFDTEIDSFELTVSCEGTVVEAPANDLCADAEVITCSTNIEVAAATATATDNPAVCGGTTGPGVWYSFVGDGQEWTITATPNAWDPEIQILSGACGAFVCEAATDNNGTSGAETASLLTVDGTEYYVFVGTWASFDTEIDSFELTVSCESIDPCGPFVGDSASNPIVITSVPYSDIQNTDECFTDQFAESFGSPDVFYQITTGPDATGLIIDLCNDTTDFDTYLYLVDETGLTVLFENDDLPSTICSFLDVPVSPNTTYYIVVEGLGASETGWYEITVEEVTDSVGIENDDCSDAIVVSCDDVINGTTVGANPENIAACGVPLSTAPGVWYLFEGTGDEVTFSLCGSSYDTKIGVFSGICDNLVCEAGNDDDCDLQSEVDVLTTLGTDYYIYVTGFNPSAFGDFVLSITCDDPTPAPVNDECAGALELTIGAEGTCDGGAGFVSTTTDGANQSIVTTCDGTIEGDADIWYFFTATSEAIAFNSLDGVPGIEIFDGNCGALGNSVGCLNNTSGSIDGLTIGNLYYAVVWTDGEEDAVEFCLQAFTPAECEAGTVTSTDSIALCPDSTTTLTSIGNVVIPSGGAYGIYFEPGPDGGGALEEEFILLNTTTPYVFDNDLNGILSGNGFPEFTGTWYVHGAVYSDPFDAFNSICDITDEFLTVTFLELGEGDCAPAPPVPVNDTCGGAITVSCDDVVNGSTADATSENLEICGTGLSSAPGVWYVFEGNGDDVTFSLCGSSFDTKIGVFSGACDALVCETGNDDACGLQSEAVVTATEIGTDYYIYVTGFGTEAGDFTLTVTCTEPEPEPGCGTAVYDNGGPAGNYVANSNDTITICPENPGEVVTLEFTFVDIEASAFGNGEQEGCWDFITLYNGASTGSSILANTLCGEQSGDGSIPFLPSSYLQVGDIFTSTDASGCLTIVFQSDASVQEGGFAADITCAVPAVCEAPIDLTVDNITETSADLSWTAVGDETIWHLEIVNLTDGEVFTGVPNVSGLTETAYNAINLDPSSDYAFYVIADCDSDSSAWAGPETFTTLTPAPENDDCDGAIAIACDDVIVGSTENATAENLEACGTGLSSAPGVWYVFEGNGDDVTFSLCGSEYDTKIGVFTGVCGDLTCVDGNDDECGTQSEVEIETEVGQDYYVYVTGFSTNAGEFTLSVTCVTPIPVPVNDTCGGAITVVCDDVITGTTANATAENLDACGTSLSSAPGVWYTFAGTGEDVTFSLCGSEFDTKIGVFTGACGDLTCEAGNDDACELQSEIEVSTEVGTNYYIYVTGFGSNAGEFTLSVTCVVPPCDTAQISAEITNANCGNDGAIDLTISGGSGLYDIIWSNGETSEDLSGLSAGEYTVNVTDLEDGCPATATFTIEGNDPLEEPVPAAITTVGCDGSGSASIDVTISGGQEPYTYLWSNGADTEDISGIPADSYSLTVTDANGCTYTTQTYEISDTGSIFELLEAVVVDVDCNGNATGSIDITLAGGVPPYIIRWSNNLHTEDISGLVAGEYIFFATDQSGCEYTSGIITVNEPSIISEASTGIVTDADCNGASTGAIDITITGGVAPYTYVWSNGSTDEDPSNLAAGVHQATVTDANGCTFLTAVYEVGEPTSIAQAGAVITNADCNGAATGAVNITVSGGTPGYSYLWSDGSTDEDLANAAAGEYTVEISDANGCTITAGPFAVGEPTAIAVTGLTITDADCNGNATGSIDIFVQGGTPPYSYSWSNGATTQDLTDVPAGDYVGTITDANGCVLVSPVLTVGEPAVISVSSLNITDADCNGASTGTIDIEVIGGTAPYTYSWSNGATTQDLVGVPAGDYVGTITDVNGCVLVSPVLTVGEPTAIEITSVIVSDVLCNGGFTGAIDIEVSGGTGAYSYAWSNGATTQDFSGLAAGDYTGTITDENGCELVATVTVGEPAAIFEALPPTVTDVTCNGEEDGEITATVQGGTLPYTITWNTGATGETISDLAPGTYFYTVIDGNGCTFASDEIDVSEPAPLTIAGQTDGVACFGEASGSVVIVVNGGTAPYTYVWSNGATSQNISGVEAGDFSVTVTDANGCTLSSSTFTVSSPSSALEASVEVIDATGNGIADGSATVTVSGGDGPYTFSWQGGFGDSETISDLQAGIYCVDVTDANGCVFTACGTVGFPTAIKDVLEISQLTLYPNPTANYTNLVIGLSKAADIQLAVVDILGKEYQHQNLSNVESAEVQFDLSNFAAGTYFIRIVVDKEMISLPVIVQH